MSLGADDWVKSRVDFIVGRAALLGTVAEHPPFPGAKPHFRIDEVIDDGERLQQLLLTTAAALPTPKPKRAAKVKRRR